MMQASNSTETLPRMLEEFLDWESGDGYKYEWNDGEVVGFAIIENWFVGFLLQKNLSWPVNQ